MVEVRGSEDSAHVRAIGLTLKPLQWEGDARHVWKKERAILNIRPERTPLRSRFGHFTRIGHNPGGEGVATFAAGWPD